MSFINDLINDLTTIFSKEHFIYYAYFLQTDYTRHLDEMVKSTEELLYVTIQDLLINARTDDGSMLLMHWESYLETNGKRKCSFHFFIQFFHVFNELKEILYIKMF